ncbi:zinc ribbon domain-containing protein [Occultella aeris]|uniref:Double zinc ribbon n=1 Tax=Occultella aeris TaxID=2761496 RepID=A0A7M4DDU3_9MICO|nr:zinc ribbon domain-containing protein [Occultella aeris]VZO35057.1 Double zinc ribbon [Occultella aeris]
MVICPECGTRNEVGEQFCGGCGTYLEWEDPAADEHGLEPEPGLEEEPEPELEQEPAPGPVPVPVPVPEPEPVPEPVPEPEPEPAPAPPPAPDPAPVPEPAPRAEQRTTAEPVPGTGQDAAATAAATAASAGNAPVPRPAADATADPAETLPPGTNETTPSRIGEDAPSGTNAAVPSGTGEAAPSGVEDSPARRADQPHSNGTPTRETIEQAKPAAAIAPALVAPPVQRRRRTTRSTAEPTASSGGQLPGAPRPGGADEPAARAPGAPMAVRPGAAKPRPAPRPVPADEPPPAPGDLICGSCGTGNVPTRKFCRRCGTSLAEAKVQPSRSWWRRLLRPDAKPGPVAGTRPKTRRRRFPTKLVSTVVILGLLTAVGLYFRPELERAYEAVLDRAQGNTAVNPTGFTASTQGAETPVTNIGDGTFDRAWTPAAPGPGVGEWVDMTFAQPFRMVRILITPGQSTVQEDFLAADRPQTLTVTTTTSTGAQESEEIVLEDRAGAQSVELVIENVVAVRLTIVDTFAPSPESFVALAEVEFRGRE